MTSLLRSIESGKTHSATFTKFNENYPIIYNCYQNRHVLISKENTFKTKCSKALKRKLRKYKLRRDGEEDQDVLNISKTLVSSLKIKSPNKQLEVRESEEIAPKNYLFKMVRRKKTTKTEDSKIVIKTQKQISKEDATTPVTLLSYNNEEKKQTNAFKLLMDSRNKSIGSNSPGKEKVVDDYEIEEIIEKKTIKAKRNLVLQKMAEAKGSIKKKELDEYQENCIKIKMEKRSEKFKSMLLNKDSKINVDKTDIKKKTTKIDGKKIEHNLADKNQTTVVTKLPKTLQLVNIFSDSGISSNCVSPTKHLLPKEDEEFLKKLSPSMRKKENMLCYFKKLEKESENSDDDSKKIIIKVKLTSNGKKRGRKKKAILNQEIINMDPSSTENNEKNLVAVEHLTDSGDTANFVSNSYDGRKRKRKGYLEPDFTSNNVVIVETDTNKSMSNCKTRPKRSVNKPIKYNDDVNMSSSDEDLQIFTPKKKKLIENKSNFKLKTEPIGNVKLSENKIKKIHSPLKKPTKLAPIFSVKTQPDLAAIDAKQKFLHSGVPDQLKKIIAQQNQINESYNDFFLVVHVQQNDTTKLPLKSQCDNLFEINNDDESIDIQSDDNLFGKLIKLTKCDKADNKQPNLLSKPHKILQDMKQLYPMFPVFRTFRLLRDKSKGVLKDLNYQDLDNSIELINSVLDINNENPDRLTWTDKYKATSSKQIIGNFESIKELRKWLELWIKNDIRAKVNSNSDSDSSDFCESDTDSRDGRLTNNLLILTGPVGSGKTSSVYAVAAELSIKVIEVNASNKRTGKIMLQDLQEATQSHKVNRTTENSQKSQELISIDSQTKKKRGRPKKINETNKIKTDVNAKYDVLSGTSASQETVRTAVSLILIDDADIVFEQDDGFTSAIVQLVQSSKRPVILVTASIACPHLQKFVQSGKILKMNPFSPRVLGTWLDIMCLADNGISQPGLGAKFLNFFKGDIRKTINCLQFYISTHTQDSSHVFEKFASQNSDYCDLNLDTEENSSMSWADREILEEKNIQKCNKDIDCVWKCFINKQINFLQFRYPLELLNIWWTLPSLFQNFKNTSKIMDKDIQDHNKIMCRKLESMAIAIDAISVSDYFNRNKPDTDINITSQPWDAAESDNVSELENMNYYNRHYELADEISHNLVTTSIIRAQNTLECDRNANIYFPGMTVQREKDRIISRHKNLTSYLNPSAVFDRRALALDYWSSCRNICRIEKTKPEIHSKRKNRFCHYLKSLNVQCKNDTFDNLCDSLGSSGKCDWNNFYE